MHDKFLEYEEEENVEESFLSRLAHFFQRWIIEKLIKSISLTFFLICVL
jgi:hypothetical protein